MTLTQLAIGEPFAFMPAELGDRETVLVPCLAEMAPVRQTWYLQPNFSGLETELGAVALTKPPLLAAACAAQGLTVGCTTGCCTAGCTGGRGAAGCWAGGCGTAGCWAGC